MSRTACRLNLLGISGARPWKYQRRRAIILRSSGVAPLIGNLSGKLIRPPQDMYYVRVGSRLSYSLAGPTRWPARLVLSADRIHQSANAQNAHHPFHVLGEDVQRHFGTYVLERFSSEVCRSHPRLYRAEGMLHSLAAQAHLVRVSVKPRLHGLQDGFVLPT